MCRCTCDPADYTSLLQVAFSHSEGPPPPASQHFVHSSRRGLAGRQVAFISRAGQQRRRRTHQAATVTAAAPAASEQSAANESSHAGLTQQEEGPVCLRIQVSRSFPLKKQEPLHKQITKQLHWGDFAPDPFFDLAIGMACSSSIHLLNLARCLNGNSVTKATAGFTAAMCCRTCTPL